eukprot:TRINITY_DN19709_c0_g1_i2.p1 TRINITY_DN19709_c0_g1~~TRINITY_DN19709_c0_g1_i2.p1  ORF type:complete len:108 (-),score=26.39 TRINITY_DN19709_c0_g1_i2:42-365(-)
MIRRPPRSTLSSSSAASDVYKRQRLERGADWHAAHLASPIHPHCLSCDRVTHPDCPAHLPDALTILHLSLIHISEPTRLLSISYAVFCLKKKKINESTPHSIIIVVH